MKHPRRLALLSFLALLSIVCTCPFGSLPGRLTRVSKEERTAALADAAQFRLSLPGVDLEADKVALADHIGSLAGIEAAGVADDGSVWGRFRDGRLLIFMYDPEPDTAPAGGSSMLASPDFTYLAEYSPQASSGGANQDSRVVAQVMDTGTIGQPTGPAVGLPESRNAYVEWSFSANKRPTGLEAVRVARWLRGKGYEVRPSEPTVEGLRQIVDAGVFVLNTHGGKGESAKIGPDGHALWIYSLMTTSPYTMAHDDDYGEDLDTGRLVYAALGTLDDPDWYYAITGDFVRHYMSFSSSSFAFISACGSYNDDMRSAFIRPTGGAAAYGGWTLPVRSTCAAKAEGALFNLLLGVNEEVSAKPPIHPFDVSSAVEYLAEKRLDQCPDPRGTAWLKVDVSSSANVRFGLLAPSIRNLKVDEEEKVLILKGIFGPDPGSENRSVTIGGVAVDKVKTWEWNEIHVTLPAADKPGGSGDVVVTIREHKSNAVPLTLWRAQLRYEAVIYPPDLQQAITYDVLFRGDVHPYRDKPGQEPIEPDVPLTPYAPGSSGLWTWSGSGVMEDDLTWTCNGSGTLPMMHTDEDQEDFLNGGFSITAQDRMLVLKTDAYITSQGSWCEMSASGVPSQQLPLPLSTFLDPMWMPLEIQLDEQYRGEPGERSGNTINGEPIAVSGKLEWDAVLPDNPPTEDTPS